MFWRPCVKLHVIPGFCRATLKDVETMENGYINNAPSFPIITMWSDMYLTITQWTSFLWADSQQDAAKLSTGNRFSINQPVGQSILKKQTETSVEGRICNSLLVGLYYFWLFKCLRLQIQYLNSKYFFLPFVNSFVKTFFPTNVNTYDVIILYTIFFLLEK